MDRTLNAGLLHAAAALGVAEVADAHVRSGLARRKELDPRALMLAAENVVDLSACRTLLSHAATLIDEQYERDAASPSVGRRGSRVVRRGPGRKGLHRRGCGSDRRPGLALSGGAGYLSGSRLARALRDVRATAFMHPLGANRAYAFLGELAAGRGPSLH
jgi:hypothetical protein